MRPVNLLPASDRAKSTPQAASGSSRIVLAVLGVMVLAMLAVVLTQNQISDKREEIATLSAEQQTAQARADKLGPYGQFAAVKRTRVKSITELARQRFDWERLMRELSLVLPDGTWVSQLDASVAGAAEASATSGPAAAAADTSADPEAQITGCAKSQARVAEAMVRLRGLYRAEDVQLESSEEPDAGSGGASAASSQSGGATSAEGCGPYYSFKASVAFGPARDHQSSSQQGKGVPRRLGGGA